MLKSAIRYIIPETLYDTLRRAKQERMVSQFPAYVSEHNYAGKQLTMHIADPVGEEWYDHDEDRLPELEFLHRFDLSGKTIFDLGAHQCLVAMLLADMAGKNGKVVAVEANAHNHGVALKNLDANDYGNVDCLHAIVSSGKLDISIDGGLNGHARPSDARTPKLEVLTIDQVSHRHGAPALVFLDIEGHEIEALDGARETLADPACNWFIELHGDEALADYGHRNTDIFRFFPEVNYNCYMLDTATGQFNPLKRDELPHDRCHIFFERRGS